MTTTSLQARVIELDVPSGSTIPSALGRVIDAASHVRLFGARDHAVALARAIHMASPRSAKAVVWMNVDPALPDVLTHSELFGHTVGAFNGAFRPYRGRVWKAQGGTLIVVGVEHVPRGMRRALDRLANAGEVWPVAASSPSGVVDVRLIEIDTTVRQSVTSAV